MTNEVIADIVFVLDATKSTQPIFFSMIDQVGGIAVNIKANAIAAKPRFGAVIYRDPVDYREVKPAKISKKLQEQIIKANLDLKKQRDEKLIKKGIDPIQFDREMEERKSHFNNEEYPFNKNVAIDIKDDIGQLIIELMKVECGSGNDDPEDWVGALDLALHSINWRVNSKRSIVWISDANAHGKLFCGYDNHNEEEPKMEPLIREMASMNIHFVGINVIRDSDNGCERTLQKMREIYQRYGKKTFLIEEFKVPQDEFQDEEIWPENVMAGLMNTIDQALKQMSNAYGDSAV